MAKKKKEEQAVTPEEALQEQTPETGEAEVNPWEEKYNAEHDAHLRLAADYDNYRKRTAKEKADIYANATAKAVEGLLPVIDNFERALLNDKDNQGFNMMYSQFCEYLHSLGVKVMEAEGAKFDPNMHIAVMHIEDENYGDNEIVQVLQKGYTLGDKVIRPACVKVAN